MSDSPEPSAATRESGAAVRFPAPPLLFVAPLAATLALHKWLPLPLPGRPVTRPSARSSLLPDLRSAGPAQRPSGVTARQSYRTTRCRRW